MSTRLTIRNLNVTYLVPRDAPNPDAIRARLDRAAGSRIASACADLLAQAVDEDDPGLWLIRSLALDLTLDVGALDDDLLVRAWSHQIARRIARAVNGPPDGQTVIYFPDRAAYLASFLRDLAGGRAWNMWYYRAFDGLRSLPDGTALAEALIREPDHAPFALARLYADGELARVLAVIGPRAARRVWDALLPDSGAQASRADVDAVLAAWHVVRHTGPYTAHRALHLLAALVEDLPTGPVGGSVRSAIEGVLALAAALTALDDHLLDRLLSGEASAWEQLSDITGSEHASGLAAAQRISLDAAGWLRGAAAVLRPARTSGSRWSAPGPTGDVFATSFAGVFLLWPTLLDLELADIVAAHPEAPVLRLLMSAACLGADRRDAAWSDPALLLAADLDDPPVNDTPQLDGVLSALLEVLAYQGRIDGACLLAEHVPRPEGDVLLLCDPQQDMWVSAIWLAPHDDPHAALTAGVAAVRAATGAEQTILLPGPELAPLLDRQVLSAYGLDVRSRDDVLPDTVQPALARWRSYARPPARDLDYLLVRTTPDELQLALIARAALRLFARKLLGFEWSSPAYLYLNFLAGSGLVTRHDDRIIVDLPRVPLRMVLSMIGVHGQRYHLPWLEPLLITLRLPEG